MVLVFVFGFGHPFAEWDYRVVRVMLVVGLLL